jgi:hypothetical protein
MDALRADFTGAAQTWFVVKHAGDAGGSVRDNERQVALSPFSEPLLSPDV